MKVINHDGDEVLVGNYAYHITVLNVAGPRASQRPGVYVAAYRCLESLLGVSPNAVIVTPPRVNG